MDETGQLLKDLSEAHGIPGYESEIRALVKERLRGFGEMEQDNVGSLVCRNGTSGPKVMLAAHLDEIGLMVSHISPEGVLRFLPLGAWWSQVLLGQRVLVKTSAGDLPGVVGAKPPHLLPQEERNKVVELKDMYIDIGAASKEQAERAGVHLGDPVVPDSGFTSLMAGSIYMGKAFDDRVGLAIMIETMRHFSNAPHRNILCGAATVMEEVGLRGARTCSKLINPDVAIVLESDLCGDVPGIRPEESNLKLGRGPSLVLLEARMIPNLKFRDLVIDTARELGIALQFSAWLGGCTDGGPIHLHGRGVPTVVLGVPARHIHSHNSIISRDDYDGALRLVIALVERLDEPIVAELAGNAG